MERIRNLKERGLNKQKNSSRTKHQEQLVCIRQSQEHGRDSDKTGRGIRKGQRESQVGSPQVSYAEGCQTPIIPGDRVLSTFIRSRSSSTFWDKNFEKSAATKFELPL